MKTKTPKEVQNPFGELFVPKWEKWKEFKKEQFRFTYKPIGEEAALKKLHELSNGDEIVAMAIIKQSIENGWMGLFKLKTSLNGNTNTGNSWAATPPEPKLGTSAARIKKAREW